MTESDLRPIIQKWLTTRELGGLLGLKGDTIKHRVQRGIYKSARKVPGKGGAVWLISVYDEALPVEIRQLYELQVNGSQPRCFLSIREAQIIRVSLEDTNRLLRQLLEHQTNILKLLSGE
jgi:hypothetical protein